MASSLRPSVAPAEALDVVDRFFDALGHFEGEAPALADLADVLASDAAVGSGLGLAVVRLAFAIQ